MKIIINEIMRVIERKTLRISSKIKVVINIFPIENLGNIIVFEMRMAVNTMQIMNLFVEIEVEKLLISLMLFIKSFSYEKLIFLSRRYSFNSQPLIKFGSYSNFIFES